MMEGFWIVQYEGVQGNGGGVAMFIRGQVFGGDSGSTYIGTYQKGSGTLKVRVRVQNFLPGVVSVIGLAGDYDLDLIGTVSGDVINATGSPVGHQSTGLAVRLTKVATLSA